MDAPGLDKKSSFNYGFTGDIGFASAAVSGGILQIVTPIPPNLHYRQLWAGITAANAGQPGNTSVFFNVVFLLQGLVVLRVPALVLGAAGFNDPILALWENQVTNVPSATPKYQFTTGSFGNPSFGKYLDVNLVADTLAMECFNTGSSVVTSTMGIWCISSNFAPEQIDEYNP